MGPKGLHNKIRQGKSWFTGTGIYAGKVRVCCSAFQKSLQPLKRIGAKSIQPGLHLSLLFERFRPGAEGLAPGSEPAQAVNGPYTKDILADSGFQVDVSFQQFSGLSRRGRTLEKTPPETRAVAIGIDLCSVNLIAKPVRTPAQTQGQDQHIALNFMCHLGNGRRRTLANDLWRLLAAAADQDKSYT